MSSSGWTVETLDVRVDRELDALAADLRASFVRIAQLLEAAGPVRVHEPHVKHLVNDLWEMRPKGRSGVARAIYVTWVERRVIILRVFQKKTQATPRREIEVALSRLAELKARK